MSQTPTTPISPTPLKTTFFNGNNVQESLISPTKEEISTIFVVGFPEDMQEREFQNMFMFSPGFEAATLKIPLTEEENNRKQIIGFAKFRTRKEAVDARDILNGRKVDAEKGCMLKAEMAKKNLHTKRGLLNEQQQQLKAYTLQEQQASQPQSPTNIRFPNHSAFEAFHSVPPIKSPSYNEFFNPDLMSPPPFDIARSQSVDASKSMDLFMKSSRFIQQENLDYLSKSTPTTELTFRAMNSLLNHTNNNNNNNNNIHHLSSSKSTGLSRVMEEIHHEPIITRFHPLNTSLSTPPKSSSPPPPGIISPTTSYRSLGGILVGSSNPADQNPPCNTLYVGNLPSNTNEEELKIMFSKCPGYKRLSFRNKSNGPMCFVEFEDTIYAAQALQELHGNPLSNSVKGGIRLSFSKNPLGVRQNNNTNGFPLMNTFNSRRESITTSNFDYFNS